MTFKVISQEDTKNKYVVLTEKQAKKVVKDLIHMDALEEINIGLESRIDNLLKKEEATQTNIYSLNHVTDAIKNLDHAFCHKVSIEGDN